MKRMSGVDAAFLYGETPAWHMHVSAVLLVDPTGDPRRLQRRAVRGADRQRLHLVPQFRWKLVEVPLGIDRPGWVEDPNFDISYHVRHIGVPPPGGPEQLGNLIGDLVGYKLDRNIPLWEMWVIDGLADDRIAILAKVHHSIIDGVSGSELATVLFDLEPDPPDPTRSSSPAVIEPVPSLGRAGGPGRRPHDALALPVRPLHRPDGAPGAQVHRLPAPGRARRRSRSRRRARRSTPSSPRTGASPTRACRSTRCARSRTPSG